MKFRLLLFCFFILPVGLLGQKLDVPYNLNFEEGYPGRLPVAWSITADAEKLGYKAYVSEENPVSGRFCLQMHHEGDFKDGQYGSLMQSVDAKQYRGKKIRFRAAVRAEIFGEDSHANLWVHIRKPNDQVGIIDNMEANPIVFNEWDYYEIVMDVPEWAESINFGLLLFGSGDVWMDDCSFEMINPYEELNEQPGELSELALDNLETFSKAYGIIKYFYADPALKNFDWGRFLLENIEQIEKIKSRDEFHKYLATSFHKIAPAVRFSESKSDYSYSRDAKALSNVALSWMHLGIPTNDETSILESKVVNVYQSRRDYNGSATQVINLEGIESGKLRFNAMVRSKLSQQGSAAQLMIAIENNDGKPIKTAISGITESSEDWKDYSVETEIPPGGKFARIALMLYGDGMAWFDSLRIEASEDSNIKIRNSSFEDGKPMDIIPSWVFPLTSFQAGYYSTISMHKPASGKQCLVIASDTSSQVHFAKEKEIYQKDIGGIIMSMPVLLFADSTQIYPKAEGWNFSKSKWPADFLINENDRTSRMAMIIEAWNLIHHFHLFSIDPIKHAGSFNESLKMVAEGGGEKLIDALENITVATGDEQYRVWRSNESPIFAFPFLWQVIDEKVYITKLHESADAVLSVGTEITKIDGQPAIEYIDKIASKIPGAIDYSRYKALARIRTGEKDSRLKFEIKNEKIHAEAVASRNIIITELEPDRPEKIEEVAPGIAYIDMSRLLDNELKELVPELKKANALIFDSRGFATLSEYMLSLFSNVELQAINWKIPIYTAPEQTIVSWKPLLSGIKPNGSLAGMDVIILCDHKTIGYTEAVVALAKYYEMARVLGTKSAGSCSEVVTKQIFGNYYMSMTAVKAELPNGKIIKDPVEPDLLYNPSIDDIRNNKNPMIQKAIEILQN